MKTILKELDQASVTAFESAAVIVPFVTKSARTFAASPPRPILPIPSPGPPAAPFIPGIPLTLKVRVTVVTVVLVVLLPDLTFALDAFASAEAVPVIATAVITTATTFLF